MQNDPHHKITPLMHVPLPVFGCVVTPVLPLSPSLCLSLSAVSQATFQWGSALFEKREKSLVPVGDAVGSSGGLTAVGPG